MRESMKRSLGIGLVWFVAAAVAFAVAVAGLVIAIFVAAAVAFAVGVVVVFVVAAAFLMMGGEYSDFAQAGIWIGFVLGIIIGLHYGPQLQQNGALSLGDGVTLKIPQNWTYSSTIIGGCSEGSRTIVAPNGASKTVLALATCYFTVTNQTGFSKGFWVDNVSANSTITVKNFTNYTVRAK
jgi:hypothetical protein